ncbi:vancomycin high temperature exclusion protein [Psychroserpens sp. NJDZ02]|uniref:SanA/YdcF family protein n=1 Tax=Psychroserpens sp. NJDZ02 TaxID=2570561 RepID=UPI0010A8E39E|nr:ElyC/SanA/YdcF family protein [Psychroserpens sp. NJDZ02]QCE41848.1 vancomycin high temperature exclusion protein [Psychroserpens sp. NJDZ02]
MKKYIIRGFKLAILLVLAILLANFHINYNAEGKLYSTIDTIPKNRVGLVLGAGKYVGHSNRVNLYYKYRLEAAFLLYQNKKIEYLLISGDNSTADYDEPSTFKQDLMLLGVPEDKIILDYAGFRTLDSVVRAKKIFGLNSFTIISQQFHNERAIYLAENNDLNVIAFNAKAIKGRYGFRTKVREYLARTKAIIDIVINKQPKFLGPKIEI